MADADLPRIKEIDKLAFGADEQYEDEVYARMLQSGLSVVACDSSAAIVGYAFVQINPYTRVRSIAVHPNSQRKGYGTAMLQAVIGRANHEVHLLVDETNEPAIRLYESLGFQPAGMCSTVPPKRRMVWRAGAERL